MRRRVRACAPGKVDGQTSRRPDANHPGKEQEKLAEGRERDLSDSRLITSPARCLLLHPVAMTLAMILPLQHLCRSLNKDALLATYYLPQTERGGGGGGREGETDRQTDTQTDR